MRYVSELAHGKTECLYQLSQKRSKNFSISDPSLFEAIFNISCIGKRISNKEMTLREAEQIGSVDESLKIIWRKLYSILGLSNESGIALKNFMTVIVKACWKDTAAIETLVKKLQRVRNKESVWYTEKKESSSRPKKLKHLSERGLYKFISRSIRQVNQEAYRI